MFYIDVALPVPLRKTFLYLPLDGTSKSDYVIGGRVRVPFGNRRLIGILSEIKDDFLNDSKIKLKKIYELVDNENIVTKELQNLLQFSNNYYHYYLGEVYAGCLPKALKEGKALVNLHNRIIRLNLDNNFLASNKKLTEAQQHLINLLAENQNKISSYSAHQFGVKDVTINSLDKQSIISIEDAHSSIESNSKLSLNEPELILNQEQEIVVSRVSQSFDEFACFLLYGITGSGKTEVYLHLIKKVIERQKQVLVLVPEISLTPQTINRFKHRFKTRIAVIHSKVSLSTKAHDWLAARQGDAKIIIGTRSGIFTPIKNLGLVIVDEEHDISFKQQESFRYHGRDLAVIRAKKLGIPVLLGSATPSIESVANVINNRYQLLTLKQRAGKARLPRLRLLNIKGKQLNTGLSFELIKQMENVLAQNNQVLLFLNRRGYAPVVKCNDCDWGGICQRCNVYYTMHKANNTLVCHYCLQTHSIPVSCPDCGSLNLNSFGVGTEQVEECLNTIFPKYRCIRIDRDTTKGKDDLSKHLGEIKKGQPLILLGTQMLAKGHHFPDVTLVAMLGIDNSLFSTDFRAPERITQLLLQVAGRAGRSDKSSEVIIQTSQPEHELLHNILQKDYWDIATKLYKIRQIAKQPPCTYWALIRAECNDLNKTMAFLKDLKVLASELVKIFNDVQILGPVFAPKVKKAGMLRGQLLLSSVSRQDLQRFTSNLLAQINNIETRAVRWSIDIDPQEMY